MSDSSLLIETAGPHDVEGLLAIERECSSHPWTREQMRQALGGPMGAGAVLVLREAGGKREIIGYCAYHVVLDELDIHNLAVRPARRRRGHARRLLAACLAEGSRGGAQRALLEVRASNREALALYGSIGFGRVGLRRGYYTQPAEDAVLLERPNLGSPVGALRSR